MVERLLSMQEALGSMPRFSIFIYFCKISINNIVLHQAIPDWLEFNKNLDPFLTGNLS